jgi:transposase
MRKKNRMIEAAKLRARGYKQREIADLLGVSERTVRTYLKNPPSSRKRTPRRSLLDPYKAFIDDLLSEQPFCSCTQLLASLQDRGYRGHITILREYVAEARVRVLFQAVNSPFSPFKR